MELNEDPEDWKKFNNKTREYVVFLLLFLALYFSSYFLIIIFKKKNNSLFAGTYEDAVAYRISLWVCTFSLGVSIGAALLLPMSIISNEVLLAYPNSYYVQWLNTSLIQGMWSLVFLFSNLALFLLLPFCHFFIESEGFPGSPKGVKARVYEASLVLLLVGILLMGITYIVSALLDDGHNSITSFFNVSNYYLPFLYSCVSFLGVLMLLICTPVGFARLFTVSGQLLMKLKTPNRHMGQSDLTEQSDLMEQGDHMEQGDNMWLGHHEVHGDHIWRVHQIGQSNVQAYNLEQHDHMRQGHHMGQGEQMQQGHHGEQGDYMGHSDQMWQGYPMGQGDQMRQAHPVGQGDLMQQGHHMGQADNANMKEMFAGVVQITSSLGNPRTRALMLRRRPYRMSAFEEYADDIAPYMNDGGLERVMEFLEVKENKGWYTGFKKNFLHPMIVILLVLLTVLSVLMVVQNTLELCFGIKALPVYSQNISLGINSLSSLGPIGAAVEIILFLYLWCTSIIGLYSLPLFCYLKPKVQNTSMTQVIGNCAILLVLSSALPVLARSLGITNFDLLGDFGKINWLGNFYIVLFHNIMFTVTTAVCLGTKITATVRNELYYRIWNLRRYSMLYVFLYVVR